jgi:hypothetical protein
MKQHVSFLKIISYLAAIGSHQYTLKFKLLSSMSWLSHLKLLNYIACKNVSILESTSAIRQRSQSVFGHMHMMVEVSQLCTYLAHLLFKDDLDRLKQRRKLIEKNDSCVIV